ncbi:unnamed protein product [Camellia sinensis]
MLFSEQLGIKEYVLTYLDPHLQPSELFTGVSFASRASGFDPQTAQIQELYQLGLKRIGLFGAAPIGCLPSQRTLAGGELRVCSEIYNQAAQLMNSKLSSAITSYNNSHNDPKARIVYTDIYNPLLNIILNHDKYGFSVADKGCCGTGNLEVSIFCSQLTDTCPDDSVYVFWDSYHPTERGYRVLVNQILQSSLNKFF